MQKEKGVTLVTNNTHFNVDYYNTKLGIMVWYVKRQIILISNSRIRMSHKSSEWQAWLIFELGDVSVAWNVFICNNGRSVRVKYTRATHFNSNFRNAYTLCTRAQLKIKGYQLPRNNNCLSLFDISVFSSFDNSLLYTRHTAHNYRIYLFTCSVSSFLWGQNRNALVGQIHTRNKIVKVYNIQLTDMFVRWNYKLNNYTKVTNEFTVLISVRGKLHMPDLNG
jgi:hypothetical protein